MFLNKYHKNHSVYFQISRQNDGRDKPVNGNGLTENDGNQIFRFDAGRSDAGAHNTGANRVNSSAK